MENRNVNRSAELLGELLYRARHGSPMWLAVVARVLAEHGHPVYAQDMVSAGSLLTESWRDRLAGRAPGQSGLVAYHPTEVDRLQPSDYPASPDGRGGRMAALDAEGAERHSFRQIAYGSFGQPCHPDVARVLEDVLHGITNP
jgi:hypothetical protein